MWFWVVIGGCCSCGGDDVDCFISLIELVLYLVVFGLFIFSSCGGMLDFKGLFILEDILVVNFGVFGIMFVDEFEFDVILGSFGWSMLGLEGGVIDVGGVFILGLFCELGVC